MRFAFFCVLIGLCAGCSVYDPALIERDAGLDGGPSDAGDAGSTDAGDAEIPDGGPSDGGPSDAGTDAGPICDPLAPPTAPAPAGGDIDLVFALRDIIVDQNDGRWATVAYDLDGACTTVTNVVGACPPPGGEAPPVDGPRGIDNAFGKEIFTLAARHDPGIESNAREDLELGAAGVVVVVRGWNGEDDDGRVDAYVAQATRGEGLGGGPPRWDGTDRWWLAETDFAGGDPSAPLLRDDVAYIANRTLVMRIPDGRAIRFPWSGANMHLTLTAGFVVARLSDDGTRLEDVVLTGRWSLVEIRAALTAAGICPGEVIRGILDVTIQRNADVRSDPRSDGTGATCDALTVAVGFSGRTATIADIESVTLGPPACP